MSMEELCTTLSTLDLGERLRQRFKQSAKEYNTWWIGEAKRSRSDDVGLETAIRALMGKTNDLLDLDIRLEGCDYDLLRFMTSPVISKDRLRTFAACGQLPALGELLDEKLFPWLQAKVRPENSVRDIAIHCLARQMANVQNAASLRTRHETYQRNQLLKMLDGANFVMKTSMNATAIQPSSYTTKLVGIRLKPDLIVCNASGDVLLLEFKACGDRTNSIKRMQEMSAKKNTLLQSLAKDDRTIQYIMLLFGHFAERSVEATDIQFLFQHELDGPECPIRTFIEESGASVVDDRTHVEIFRSHAKGELQAAILRPQDDDDDASEARVFATDADLMLFFNDLTTITVSNIIEDDEELFDVSINGMISHTCMYRYASQDGVIVHIFKEGDKVKIAQAAESFCYSSDITRRPPPKKKGKKKRGSRLKQVRSLN